MTPPPGHRSGSTYDEARDFVRLNRQADDVWRLMRNGEWWTLRQLSHASSHPEASVSARLRDFRKDRFGRHVVQRLRRSNGKFLYRLVPNPEVKVAGND